MAKRRMFNKDIVMTDRFCSLPVSSRCLYYELAMNADDDGFIGNPKLILRMLGFNEDDLKILISKEYIIPFESGIIVITNWKQHNNIQKDRYTPTIYIKEKSLIEENQNKGYYIKSDNQQFFPQK